MYLDTAILVKLFVSEPDSEFFGKLTDGENISSSVLSSTEFFGALLRKTRNGEITVTERQGAWASFENAVGEGTIELAPFHEALFKKANRIMEQCSPQVALRSLDALHLATCDQLQDWPLVTTDVRMRQAAELLRFPLNELPK
ncbi:MAG: type II toxin-antitoxin system VapC family toxin [Verrucomicrobiota bacterium]